MKVSGNGQGKISTQDEFMTYASYISTIYNLGISAVFSTQRSLMLRINRGYAKRLKRPKTMIHIMVNLYDA